MDTWLCMTQILVFVPVVKILGDKELVEAHYHAEDEKEPSTGVEMAEPKGQRPNEKAQSLKKKW